MLTYVWAGFLHARELDDVSPTVAALGSLVFGVGALVLLATAVRALKRPQPAVPHLVP